MSSHQLQTEIDAVPEQVWAILTDFAAYSAWNPSIKYIRGIPKPGARLEVCIQPSGAKGMTFRPLDHQGQLSSVEIRQRIVAMRQNRTVSFFS